MGVVATDAQCLRTRQVLLLPLLCCLQGVFELLCNFSLIPEWDVLFKGGRYLSYARDPAGCCEVAYLHIVYGLPGEEKGGESERREGEKEGGREAGAGTLCMAYWMRNRG